MVSKFFYSWQQLSTIFCGLSQERNSSFLSIWKNSPKMYKRISSVRTFWKSGWKNSELEVLCWVVLRCFLSGLFL